MLTDKQKIERYKKQVKKLKKQIKELKPVESINFRHYMSIRASEKAMKGE
jgi:hypothetical protein